MTQTNNFVDGWMEKRKYVMSVSTETRSTLTMMDIFMCYTPPQFSFSFCDFCLFYLILYVPSTIFQVNMEGLSQF